MGRILRLAGVNITDSTAPIIKRRDKIESVGSLFLFDGNHEFGQFTGLPAPGASIPNVLADRASEALSVTEAAVNSVVGGSSIETSTFKKERTAKGGIHGITTHGSAQTIAERYEIYAADAIRNHVIANPTHSYYMSIWQRVTRKSLATTAVQPPYWFTNGAGATSNYHFFFDGSETAPAPSNADRCLGAKVVPPLKDNALTGPADRFTSLGVKAMTGSGADITQKITLAVGIAGPWSGFNLNKGASRIIYRAYMEDLTLSGRTYAEVEALDYAMWLEAFAEGGKFHGDTFTDPSTLP